MEVNSKSSHSHHLACLSGSSQTPLIPLNENGSERSTPISGHSLSFGSPNKTHHHLATPLPLNSASINTTASIFFPPLPARSNHQLLSRPQILLESNNKSPKSADINMNVEHERNREASHISTISPSQSRFSVSNSSKLNSPLSMPTKSFPCFFPESNLFTQQQHQQQVRRSINLTTSNSTSSNWDDSYHLYHEPIDLDEQNPQEADPLRTQIFKPDSSSNMVSTPKSADNLNHCPLTPHARSKIVAISTNSNSGTKDWPFVVQNTPTNKSPTITNNDHINNANTRPISSSFAERAGPSRRNDVSADIYFCYVTLKSNERSNHRSRSYHGPKNTSSHNQTNQLPYVRDANKNLSSTSVTDLPMSPSAFTSAMIPIHFRDHCVRELIETESNYVHALEMIITCFAKPLESFLKRDDNQLIFGHIKYFHHIHSAFQTDLVKAAFKSYNKDIANLSSPTRNPLATATQDLNQANSNPSTPTSTAVNNIPQFLSASPLSSPTAQDMNVSPPLSTANKTTNGDSFKISSCFLNIKDKFLKYGEYCATLSKAQALLDELTSKSEAIAVQLDRCQHDANEGKFKLRDLLSLPMQRILKYHLLLAQLIKNTSATNDDYHGLKRAHETMVDLGQYINEVKRDTEAIQIINDIEQSITGLNMPSNTQLTDYGRLVTDGFIRVKVPYDMKTKPHHDTKIKLPHDTKIKQKRYVFVFDKVMLMCKVSGVRGYQYKEALVLSEYEIDTNPVLAQNEIASKHATKEKWSYNFNLIRSSDKTTYSFYAKSSEIKNKWIDSIQKAMDNIRPAACRNNETTHEFLMHTFDKASTCDHCGKLLLGLYYQGYRCRACFIFSHKKCLATIKPCGPTLPPRPSITLSHSRGRCNEPPSPSVRSNCSDDSHNAFMHFPSNIQCVDVMAKNEYSNIDCRANIVNQSSSFRENGPKSSLITQRPVSSMINVSLQNSTNHLLQQRRLLKGSNSTPAISQRASLRARALIDCEGNEDTGHLQIQLGDIVLVYKSSVKPTKLSKDDVDHSLAQLKISANSQNSNNDSSTNGVLWWVGKNLRTGKEGQFPSNVVEIVSDQNRIQVDSENSMNEVNPKTTDFTNCEFGTSYVNFILNDYPWFCGRMERDKAQALIESMPHGTFLVRVSPKHNGSYVISLNYNSQVKHMRIYVSKDNQLYLSQNRYFKSVIDLVSWYEKNSLVESFHMLDARLTIPFKAN